MSVEPKSTLKETVDNAVSKNGGIFFVLFSVSSLIFFIAVESRTAATEGAGPLDGILPEPFIEAGALVVDMPRSYAVFLAFLGLFIGSYFAVVTVRVFVGGHDTVPRETYAENFGKTTVNLFLGVLAFFPLLVIGLLLPVLVYVSVYGFGFSALLPIAVLLGIFPGAFVAVSFGFFAPYAAVEDAGFIEAFEKSWGMTKGHRWALFLLFLALIAVFVVISTVFLAAYVFLWGVTTLLAQLMLAFGGSAVLVFTLSLVSTVFRNHHADAA